MNEGFERQLNMFCFTFIFNWSCISVCAYKRKYTSDLRCYCCCMLSSSVIHHGFMLKVNTLERTAPADRQLLATTKRKYLEPYVSDYKMWWLLRKMAIDPFRMASLLVVPGGLSLKLADGRSPGVWMGFTGRRTQPWCLDGVYWQTDAALGPGWGLLADGRSPGVWMGFTGRRTQPWCLDGVYWQTDAALGSGWGLLADGHNPGAWMGFTGRRTQPWGLDGVYWQTDAALGPGWGFTE